MPDTRSEPGPFRDGRSRGPNKLRALQGGAVAVVLVAVTAALAPQAVAAAPAASFRTQPSAVTYNVPFSPEMTVAITDGGAVVSPAPGTVTFSITTGTGTAGAAMTCSGSGPGGRTFPIASGVATGAGCAVDRAGHGYRVDATWSQGVIVTSAAFDVLPGPAARLAFSTQPGLAVEGTAFLRQPVVEIQDAAGQLVPTASADVALGISPGSGVAGALFACPAGVTAVTVAGVAHFTGCSIDRPGPTYKLAATATGLALGTSDTFGVADTTPARLGFVTQPAAGTPDRALAMQPSVEIEDANGVLIPTVAARAITLALGGNSGIGALTCTGGLSRSTVAGVASFAGCAVDRVALGYVLIASTPGLTSATSGSFDVADHLAFVQQPTGAAAGQPFAAEPRVSILAGVIGHAASDEVTPVTISIRPGTGAPGAILSCAAGLTQRPTDGVVQFGTCAIDRPGSGYVLVVTSPGLASASSAPFTVVPGPFTLTPSAGTITWGASVALSVSFRPPNGSGAGGLISIQAARDGQTWYAAGTVTTDAGGRAVFMYRPANNLYYRATYAGSSDVAGAVSPMARVVVRQIALLRPGTAGTVTHIPRGGSITFSVTVRPFRTDLPTPSVTFYFYRQVGTTQVLVTKRVVSAGPSGVASTTWTFQLPGAWSIRAMANPTPYNANSTLTPAARYSVP